MAERIAAVKDLLTCAGVCSLHPEVPPLFCLDEARTLCPVCEFSQHKEHTVVSVEQAGTELKQQLHTQLQALLKQEGEVQALRQVYKDIQQHSEKQAQLCERQIRAEFDWLHRFLKEEEELRMTALREEQRRQAQAVGPELGRIRERLASLNRSIQEVERQLQMETGDFIRTYKPLQSPNKHLEPLPQVRSGLLLNQAKILGNLSFKVWRKMRNIVQFSPIILDPNTAHPELHLSDDLASVRRADPPLELPDNPERFSKGVLVVGSEGFSSGTHCWEVEVEDYPQWKIGVIKESIDRKKAHVATPENGYWCIRFNSNEYYSAHQKLNLKKRLQKIQVQLNCDGGKLSFYDPRDMSLIYSYKDTFTQRIFPVFYVGPSNAQCQTNDIRIGPVPAHGRVL